MDFIAIKPADRELLMPHLQKLRFIDTGFTALYYVADSLNVRYACIRDSLVVAFDLPENTAYTLFGVEQLACAADALVQDAGASFICVPQSQLDAYRTLPGYVAQIRRSDGFSDYLCRYDDFVSLKSQNGRRKCKDYNRFVHRNDYSVREIAEENLGDVRALMDRWCQTRDCADCLCGCERDWVAKLLDAWSELPAKGLLVDIDGSPQGFAIAELCGDTMLRLVGKPVGRQEGLHVFLGIQTALRQFPDAAYVNSGPALGLPGLTLMKQKFKPYTLLDKYTVTLRRR